MKKIVLLIVLVGLLLSQGCAEYQIKPSINGHPLPEKSKDNDVLTAVVISVLICVGIYAGIQYEENRKEHSSPRGYPH